jgi:tRNA (cmo5U34)-methyltransferase
VTTTSLEFFESVSAHYDRFIKLAAPRYDEMIWTMFSYLPEDFQPSAVLELGCGTGILTEKIHERWPECRITAVDLSPEMMGHAKKRLPGVPIRFVEGNFETLTLPDGQFDLVMSNLAIHHIEAPYKRALIENVYQWLKPGGFFVQSDEIKSNSERLLKRDLAIWLDYVREQGATPEEAASLYDHFATIDKPSTLQEHIRWFEGAGFEPVEVLWRYGLEMVIQGEKKAPV